MRRPGGCGLADRPSYTAAASSCAAERPAKRRVTETRFPAGAPKANRGPFKIGRRRRERGLRNSLAWDRPFPAVPAREAK